MMNASLGKIMHFELLQVIGIVQFMHIPNSRGPVYEFKTIFKLIH